MKPIIELHYRDDVKRVLREMSPCESSFVVLCIKMIQFVTAALSVCLYPSVWSRGFSLHSFCSGQHTGGLRLHQRVPTKHFCPRGHRAGRAERSVHWRRRLQVRSDQDEVSAGGLSGQRWDQGERKDTAIQEGEVV